jgi:hypothetical protein
MARNLTLGAVIFLMAASAFAAKPVQTSAKAGVDFSSYQTYGWAEHRDLVEGHPLAEGSPLDTKIKATADKLLEQRGFTRVGRHESPDLLVNYVGYGQDIFESEGVTKEITSGVSWIGDVNAHSMRSYREGTLVFEVVDTASGDMVWSGWVTELAPTIEKLRKKAEKATRRVFVEFPSR